MGDHRKEARKMTLPDYSTGIISQINTFLSWSTVSGVVAIVIGVAVASMILALFMRVFVR